MVRIVTNWKTPESSTWRRPQAFCRQSFLEERFQTRNPPEPCHFPPPPKSRSSRRVKSATRYWCVPLVSCGPRMVIAYARRTFPATREGRRVLSHDRPPHRQIPGRRPRSRRRTLLFRLRRTSNLERHHHAAHRRTGIHSGDASCGPPPPSDIPQPVLDPIISATHFKTSPPPQVFGLMNIRSRSTKRHVRLCGGGSPKV